MERGLNGNGLPLSPFAAAAALPNHRQAAAGRWCAACLPAGPGVLHRHTAYAACHLTHPLPLSPTLTLPAATRMPRCRLWLAAAAAQTCLRRAPSAGPAARPAASAAAALCRMQAAGAGPAALAACCSWAAATAAASSAGERAAGVAAEQCLLCAVPRRQASFSTRPKPTLQPSPPPGLLSAGGAAAPAQAARSCRLQAARRCVGRACRWFEPAGAARASGPSS